MNAKAWIYVLHLVLPHWHAQHYLGCSASLLDRLSAHALARGSSWTRYWQQEGLMWQLGGLYQAPDMRAAERWAKRAKKGPQFCQICSGTKQARIPGAIQVDLAAPERNQNVRS